MYPFNYPTPQGATLDIFNAPSPTADGTTVNWVKPPNAGMVWITAIGAGGGGGTGSGDGTFFGYAGGGGAGAIVNTMLPAIFCPPELTIQVGVGGSISGPTQTATNTIIYYKNVALITADSGANGTSAAASGATSNGGGGAGGTLAASSVAAWIAPFAINTETAGGAGTAGSTAQSLPASATIGGIGGASDSQNGQYGYSVSDTFSAVSGLLTFKPLQTFGGNRRTYNVTLSANTTRYRAPNGAGGAGGGSRQTSPTCPGHQGGHGLVVIVTW